MFVQKRNRNIYTNKIISDYISEGVYLHFFIVLMQLVFASLLFIVSLIENIDVSTIALFIKVTSLAHLIAIPIADRLSIFIMIDKKFNKIATNQVVFEKLEREIVPYCVSYVNTSSVYRFHPKNVCATRYRLYYFDGRKYNFVRVILENNKATKLRSLIEENQTDLTFELKYFELSKVIYDINIIYNESKNKIQMKKSQKDKKQENNEDLIDEVFSFQR